MPETRWLDPLEDRAWRGYRRMTRLLYSQLARDLDRSSGLSDPDYDVLSTLSEAPEYRWRASQLAEHLQWSTSRLSHHVGRMQLRGLVARKECETDGRGAEIELTNQGLRAIGRAAPEHVDSVRRHFIDLLTTEQLEALDGIARTVVDHLGAPHTTPAPTS